MVTEKSPGNYAAYAPDLPDCIATGATREETVWEMRRALAFHVESLREHGEPVPEPRCIATMVNVAAHARSIDHLVLQTRIESVAYRGK